MLIPILIAYSSVSLCQLTNFHSQVYLSPTTLSYQTYHKLEFNSLTFFSYFTYAQLQISFQQFLSLQLSLIQVAFKLVFNSIHMASYFTFQLNSFSFHPISHFLFKQPSYTNSIRLHGSVIPNYNTTTNYLVTTVFQLNKSITLSCLETMTQLIISTTADCTATIFFQYSDSLAS